MSGLKAIAELPAFTVPENVSSLSIFPGATWNRSLSAFAGVIVTSLKLSPTILTCFGKAIGLLSL